MQIEKMALYILKNHPNLTRADLKEIIKAINRQKKNETEKTIKKLLENSDIQEKKGRLILLSKARRKMIKPDNKVPYNGSGWSRRWTMVLFDIPEHSKKIRDTLRYKLQKLGFGMMQGSVWVRPVDVANEIRRIIRGKNLQWQVKVLSFNMAAPDEKEIIHRIWKMDKLNEEYRCFVKKTIKRFKKLKAFPFHNEKLLLIALDLLSRITEKEYLNIYLKDPKLPTGLQSKDWHGKKAYNIYRQLDKYLTKN
ncbi:CRISPR-associated endonuclease Cas2 [Patescibacteria group bacterium]|nr:CRISPR-associated endonuclease Cas2 [Patescibacteria group bacterium]